MTEETSRYFYSWGPRAVEAAADPQIPVKMFELANIAFEEDRRIIEAQQKVRALRPEPEPLVIGHDRGPSLMRSVFEKMLRKERETPQPAASFGPRAMG